MSAMGAGDRVYPDSAPIYQRPPGGAYYSVKQDRPLPPPATYRSRRRANPCCCCLLWLCSIVTILVVVLGLAVLIFWLVVRPTAPKFQLENFRITGLDTTDGTSSSVNTTVSVDIVARNPNKKIGIYYDSIKVHVETEGVFLGDKYLTPFYQGHKNTTTLPVVLEYKVPVNQRTLAIVQNPENVPLDVDTDVRVRLKLGDLKTRRFKVKVRCDLVVDLTANKLKSNKCKVKW